MAPLTATLPAPQTIREPTAAAGGALQQQPPAAGASAAVASLAAPAAAAAAAAPAPAAAAAAAPPPHPAVVPVPGGLTPDTIPWMALAHSLLYTSTPTPPTRTAATPPLLIVLDLNGVLVERWSPHYESREVATAAAFRAPDAHLRQGVKLWVRPGARRFVAAMTRRHTVGVWSSAAPSNVAAVLDVLWARDDARRLAFVRSRGGCRADTSGGGGQFGTEKVLADLRDPRFGVANTVMVDDTPSKVRRQPANAVIVPEFSAAAAEAGRVDFLRDDTLDWLALYLEYVALGRGTFGGGPPPAAGGGGVGEEADGAGSGASDVRGCMAVLPFGTFVAAGRTVAMALSGSPTAGAIYGYPYVSPVFVWTQMGDMVHRLRTSAEGWTPPAERVDTEGMIGPAVRVGKEETMDEDAYVPQ